MAKTAIILGGHGFLGSALAAEAKKRGWETIPVDHSNYKQCAGRACELLINANGNSKKYVAEQDASLDFDLSVRSVALALHDFQPKLTIYLSSIDVYSDKSNPLANHEEATIDAAQLSRYGFHKLLAEQLVRYYAEAWLILRLGGFVGPGLKKNSIYDLLSRQPVRVHPDSRYQYLDTASLANIVFQLVELGLQKTVFNLAGDGTISVREIARLIPGEPLTGVPLEKQPEHYEVNIVKIKKLVAIPATGGTVAQFVRAALGGAIKLT